MSLNFSKKNFPKNAPLEFARNLRRDDTFPERLLWSKLRSRQLNGLKFRRQQVLGHYIVDFLCEEKKLIVELDGKTHEYHKDRMRDMYFEERSYRVLRVLNDELLKNLELVLSWIYQACMEYIEPVCDQ